MVGINGVGLLGDIKTRSSVGGTATNTPIIALSVNSGYAETGAAGGHVLALTSEGDVYAWGYNSNGQLGTGDTDRSNYPVRVLSGVSPYWYTVDSMGERHVNEDADTGDGIRYLTGVVAIATGYDHSLALLKDGTILAWGNTYNGQAGDPVDGVARSLTPNFVRQGGSVGEGPWLNNAVMVQAAGTTNQRGTSMVLRSDGTIWAWGDNSSGQLGDYSTRDKRFPNPVLVNAGAFNAATVGQGYTAKGTVDTLGADNKLVAPHRDAPDVDNYLTDTGVVLTQVTDATVFGETPPSMQ